MIRQGWHCLNAGRKLGYEDGRVVRRGVWYTARCHRGRWPKGMRPRLCCCGMHASPTLVTALDWASYDPGGYLCKVEVDGAIPGERNKFVGIRRRVLKWIGPDQRDKVLVAFLASAPASVRNLMSFQYRAELHTLRAVFERIRRCRVHKRAGLRRKLTRMLVAAME